MAHCRRRQARSTGRDGPGSANEDSDSAVGSADGEPGEVADGFRVRVSLERFFRDERARVLVWAERSRPASWLLRRLRAALTLPAASSLALVAGGCLLPPGEPLAVLRPDDMLEVIISSGEKVPAVEERERGVERATGVDDDDDDELEVVKRRALRLLDVVEAGGEREAAVPAPRRRRRVRRRRAAPPTPADDGEGAAPLAPSQWRAELGAGAGVVRAASPPRAARLVSAAQ